MPPTNKPTKSLLSGLSIMSIIMTIAAIILILLLINSGWTITGITVGPVGVGLQKPTETVWSLQTSSLTAIISSPETPSPLPEIVHVPTIIKVEEREEYIAGELNLFKDIYFRDAAGDANWVVYELVLASIAGVHFDNDPILSLPSEQKIGTYVTATWECKKIGTYRVILKAQIMDQARNLSEPIELIFKCR